MAELVWGGQDGGVITKASPEKTSRTFLLVDDHAGFRRTVRDFLPADAEVVECGDGGEAVRAHANHRPDWTLMDLEMPGMDGLAATRAILFADPQARVAIITSHDTAECRAEAELAGATAFVPKADLSTLFELLSHP
jgi:two-component system response regulator DesR